jgi:hypothetical protein
VWTEDSNGLVIMIVTVISGNVDDDDKIMVRIGNSDTWLMIIITH